VAAALMRWAFSWLTGSSGASGETRISSAVAMLDRAASGSTFRFDKSRGLARISRSSYMNAPQRHRGKKENNIED
jgi:hypothetical protein